MSGGRVSRALDWDIEAGLVKSKVGKNVACLRRTDWIIIL